ncbi:hypothetical protein [Prevotella sp. P6B1]|uniref:hypothetical protein n=1 Tax=Prevotella sp. P6B1 TaxID=1410613 RepID=UPI0012DDBBE4|nr:hypothetical protein [Prevotella sp. P6B1]
MNYIENGWNREEKSRGGESDYYKQYITNETEIIPTIIAIWSDAGLWSGESVWHGARID